MADLLQSSTPLSSGPLRPKHGVGRSFMLALAMMALPVAAAGAAAILLAQHQIDVAARLDDQTLPQLIAAQRLSGDVNALTNYAMQFQNVGAIAERATLLERIDSRNASIDRHLAELQRRTGNDSPALRRLTAARADLGASIAELAAVTETAVRDRESLRTQMARLRSENAHGMESPTYAGLRELAALATGASSQLILRNIARQFDAAAAAAPPDETIERLTALMQGEEGVVAVRRRLLEAQQQQRFIVRRQADVADQMAAQASALAADAEAALNEVRRSAVAGAERLRGLLGAGMVAAAVAGLYAARRLHRRVIVRLTALNDALADGGLRDSNPMPPGPGDELDCLAAGMRAMQAVIDSQADKLERLACTDSLTGLADRRRFLDATAAALARLRSGRGEEAALLLIDVDHFHAVNELLGAAAGDRALQRLAETLRRRCGGGQIPARLEGDAFAVLMPGASPAEAEIFAMRLRQSAADAQQPDAPSADDAAAAALTICVGVTQLQADDRTPDDALRRAGQALRRAKREGRNRVVVTPTPAPR